MRFLSRYSFILFSILILFSCGADKSEPVDENKEESNQNVAPIKEYFANKEAVFTIEGMSCQINCVTSVKKALKKMDGVTHVEIDFDEERTADICKVHFDDTVLSMESLKIVIESVNDQSYIVTESILLDLNNDEAMLSYAPNKHKNKPSSYHSSSSYELPSILDFVLSLF